MSKVSMIIPVRGEQYKTNTGESVLARTVRDIFEKASGDIEVIVIFDGPPYQELPRRDNLIVDQFFNWRGGKVAINHGVRKASGKYIFKVDGHCMFDEGFDEILQQDMEPNWVVMPRFKILNAEEWKLQDNRFYDYFMLSYPFTHPRGVLFKAGTHWNDRATERANIPIDENMRNHGSGFFMERSYFVECLGGLDPTNGAGSWNGEDLEISFKTWLGPWDGKIMVNKKTWYAHMHRGSQRPREFGFSHHDAYESARWSARYWMTDQWEKRVRDFDWLIKKFFPIPGWPENWEQVIQNWRRDNNV